jgi:hypothetical protein
MRTVTVDVADLLDLVNSAGSYGFGASVFLAAMGDWAGWVTDEEIEAFAARYLTPEVIAKGYSEEDAAEARSGLREWRNRYCRKGEKR